MKTDLLIDICNYLRNNGFTDMSKSILSPTALPECGTGIMKLFQYLPEHNLSNIRTFLDSYAGGLNTVSLFSALEDNGLLEFEPYTLQTDNTICIVCAVNRFITYRAGHFYVATDLSTDSTISVSKGDVSPVILRMLDEISTDCYNVIVAELICTAFMCRNLRDHIRKDGSCVTEFLRVILRNCKALPIYSIETYKSKLSWVCLSKQSNTNFTVDNTYNISIGSDGVTLEYMSPMGTIEHTGFVFEGAKLEDYDALCTVPSSYFAYALYLMVSDIYSAEFQLPIVTDIQYSEIPSMHELYRR